MKDLGVALVGGGVLLGGCGVAMIGYRVANDAFLLYSVVYGTLLLLALTLFILACMALRWVFEAAMAYIHREQERTVVTARIGTMTPGPGQPVGYLPAMQASTPHRVEGHDVVDVVPGKSGQSAGQTILGWPDEGGTV